jgi:SAM-dependent methyltransferase
MSPTTVSDSWVRGDPYERYVGRWSRAVAPRFLHWLNIAAGRRWLDVGCGTGALSAAILDHCAPAAVTGVEPSDGFRATAAAALAGRVALAAGTATAIPLADASVDVVVSGLVLNFVPDAAAGLAEMKRVSTPGGTIGAYVWDYAGKMELMRHFWDAAVALEPAAAQHDEGIRFPLCQSDALRRLFSEAGLDSVETTAIEVPTLFETFEDYWTPFEGGQGPAPTYAMSLSAAARVRLRDALRERLQREADGSIRLMARAWGIRGSVARPAPSR